MNGIEKITARITNDAQAEAQDILREGEAKVRAIREKYEAQAKEEALAAKARGEEAAQRQYERLESAAAMDAKKMLLSTKQELIDEAFRKAQQQLLSLPADSYANLLAVMAVKASRTGREEILLSPQDRKNVGEKVVAKANELLSKSDEPQDGGAGESKVSAAIKKMVRGVGAAGGLTLSKETRDIAGGLILRDGSVELNCALETQLRTLRESMTAQIAGILFA